MGNRCPNRAWKPSGPYCKHLCIRDRMGDWDSLETCGINGNEANRKGIFNAYYNSGPQLSHPSLCKCLFHT